MPFVRSFARWPRRRLRRSGPRVALLVLLLTLFAGVVPAAAFTAINASPPSAAGVLGTAQPSPLPPSASWGGFELTATCLRPHNAACLQIEVEGRVTSATSPYDATSGWARVTADGSGAISRVQISRVVLGTQYGVLTESGAVTSANRPAEVTLGGPSHLWGRLCSTRYHVAVYWSARLADGSLRTGKLLGPWYSAPSC